MIAFVKAVKCVLVCLDEHCFCIRIVVLGSKRMEDYSQDTTTFYEIQDQYWEPLIEERNKDLEAKAKFQGKWLCIIYQKEIYLTGTKMAFFFWLQSFLYLS